MIETMELRPKSFAVLKYLVENAGRLVAKDELINAIWPSVSVTDESLTHCVSDIRRALSDSDQRLIRTVARRGYLFTAAVSRVGDQIPATRSDPPSSNRLSAGRSRYCVAICSKRTSFRRTLIPKIWRVSSRRTMTAVPDVIERLGGLLAPFSGEGVLAYFGVPLAGEDDAERAVRAGLGIVYAAAASTPPARTFGLASQLDLGSCASVATTGTLTTLWSAKHPILRLGFKISPPQTQY